MDADGMRLDILQLYKCFLDPMETDFFGRCHGSADPCHWSRTSQGNKLGTDPLSCLFPWFDKLILKYLLPSQFSSSDIDGLRSINFFCPLLQIDCARSTRNVELHWWCKGL
ncbi:hypothetical protein PGT21_012243 [Puccinia graminis f. sp. tritici]|uniref:Uncharacterized protein n=1 Tax=Puccinia graminis f. sp. tritici TaxID=56615 RepID=A0A5B0Q5R1_PUCGR|nr:hypothetical protein PGT21_012243 [Puccinia graminis f. sp. tritici]